MSEPRTPPSNDVPTQTTDAPAVGEPAAKSEVPRCCASCWHAIWDASDSLQTFGFGRPVRPRCSNHPDSPARMRKVPGLGPCRNWEARPTPPVRFEPDEPVGPDECKITLTKGLVATVDPEDYEWRRGFRRRIDHK